MTTCYMLDVCNFGTTQWHSTHATRDDAEAEYETLKAVDGIDAIALIEWQSKGPMPRTGSWSQRNCAGGVPRQQCLKHSDRWGQGSSDDADPSDEGEWRDYIEPVELTSSPTSHKLKGRVLHTQTAMRLRRTY